MTGVLNRVATAGTGSVPWQDPVVISLGAMLVWLLATEVFRLVYPPAREGRKVAYLTVSSFVFLVLVLVSFSRPGSLHTPAQGQGDDTRRGHRPGRCVMNLRMVGCTHRDSGLDLRQQLAFTGPQIEKALAEWGERFGGAELAILSTCNRVELYMARPGGAPPVDPDELVQALVGFHGLPLEAFQESLRHREGREAVGHLLRVSCSLDSMVVGEGQILGQVKSAYETAERCGTVGEVLSRLFHAALRTARRVAGETTLHRHRVSIPSVAIGGFASQLFERLDDKRILVIGAGKMADESLRYLRDAGATNVCVVNRGEERGRSLAEKWAGECLPWEQLFDQLAAADIVLSATASGEPVVSAEQFDKHVAPARRQRPLFVMDLSVPRDFDPGVGDRAGVYLYSLDDLDRVCQRNLAERAKALPAAEKIVAEETDRFFAHAHHRAAAPVISGLRRELEGPKEAELARLFNKLPDLDEQSRREIERFADRLVNKMLHPPMESIRDASENGTHHGLLEAMRQLFRLED